MPVRKRSCSLVAIEVSVFSTNYGKLYVSTSVDTTVAKSAAWPRYRVFIGARHNDPSCCNTATTANIQTGRFGDDKRSRWLLPSAPALLYSKYLIRPNCVSPFATSRELCGGMSPAGRLAPTDAMARAAKAPWSWRVVLPSLLRLTCAYSMFGIPAVRVQYVLYNIRVSMPLPSRVRHQKIRILQRGKMTPFYCTCSLCRYSST